MTKFSIVIPVYNGECVLKKSISSALRQTESDIEVIAVDDASTDNSLSMMKEIEKGDNRLHVLHLEKNSSALSARIQGVAAASGEYVLFLDADDALEQNACATLWKVLQEQPVDILHFGMNLINVNSVSEADMKSAASFTEPYCKRLDGDEVFFACFRDGRFGWNLAGKAFRTPVCKRGHAQLESLRILRGEDTYEYFAVSYFAKSYLGIDNTRLYNYEYGSGADGKQYISLDRFRSMCSGTIAVNAIRRFLDNVDATQEYYDAYETCALKLAGHSLYQFKMRVPDCDKPEAFRILLEEWGAYYGICAIAARYWEEPGTAAKLIAGSPALKGTARPVKTIGTYYHHYTGGGTENVQRYLIKAWREMGYKVIAFVDNDPGCEIELEVDGYYLLPESVRCNKTTYPKRAKAFKKAIEESNVDFFVYHYYDSITLLWEMLFCKTLSIPTIVYHHNSFSYLLHRANVRFTDFPPIYALADGVIALSKTDEQFWGLFNDNVIVLPSPLDYRFSNNPPTPCFEKHVLYLGRVAPDKRTDLALQVFDRVADLDKDARFSIVGGSGDRAYIDGIRKKLSEMRNADRIEYFGWDDDAEVYYRSARVMLMTSEIEGYPLTLIECGAMGTPCVMFDLPYLAIIEDNDGIVSVPFGNIEAAASKICKVLEDDELYLHMHKSAIACAQEALDFDHKAAWMTIISKLEGFSLNAGKEYPVDGDQRIMWDTLLSSCRRAISYWRNRALKAESNMRKTQKDLNKSRKQIAKIKRSSDWRVGSTVMKIVKRVKRPLGKGK